MQKKHGMLECNTNILDINQYLNENISSLERNGIRSYCTVANQLTKVAWYAKKYKIGRYYALTIVNYSMAFPPKKKRYGDATH